MRRSHSNNTGYGLKTQAADSFARTHTHTQEEEVLNHIKHKRLEYGLNQECLRSLLASQHQLCPERNVKKIIKKHKR